MTAIYANDVGSSIFQRIAEAPGHSLIVDLQPLKKQRQ